MAQPNRQHIAPPRTLYEPLQWIGAYKLLKAALALLGGLMVLRLMHRSLPDIAAKWMGRLHIDPYSVLGRVILHHILLIKRRSLGWFAAGLFVYVPIAVAEGVGLLLRKVWAEWITLVTTAAMIPLEVREIIARPTVPRLVILVLNVAVLIYLIVRLRRDHNRRLHEALPGPVIARSTGLLRSTNPPPPSPQSDALE